MSFNFEELSVFEKVYQQLYSLNSKFGVEIAI